jgi:probable rRNA maturation factor
MAIVNFFSEDISFKLPNSRKVSTWIQSVIKNEKRHVKELNYIFCSDDHLRQINIQYLNHHSFTDIITFDTSEDPDQLEGDIFISIDRVKENAQKFDVSFLDELNRVIIHGVLHLLGYSDKTLANRREMRKKEDAYLSLR